MARFTNTTELQRSLLQLLATQQMVIRTYIGQAHEEWMKSSERQFIFDIIRQKYDDSKSLVTDRIFEYEVEKNIKPTEKDFYLGEWNLIKGLKVTESAEALIDMLGTAETGLRTMDLAEQMVILLEQGKIDEAVNITQRGAIDLEAKTRRAHLPPVELTDYLPRKELIYDKRNNPQKYLGMKTGFGLFDRLTGGLFNAEFSMIAAVTGVGKSTLMKAMEFGVITENPTKNVLHIANEENLMQVQLKFDAVSTMLPFGDFKHATISDSDIIKWENRMTEIKTGNFGGIYIKEIPAHTSMTEVERAYFELEAKGIKIDAIFIDMLSYITPVQKAWNENDERKKVAEDAKELARCLNLPVVAAVQAATVVQEKQEKGKRAGKLDVYGSKAQIHPCNTFIIITKGRKDDTQKDREEWERDVYWTIGIEKNRDGPPFSFQAKHLVREGAVEQVNAIQGQPLSNLNDDDDDEKKEEKKEEPLATHVDKVLEEIEKDKKAIEAGEELEQIPEDTSEEVGGVPSSIRGLIKKKKRKKPPQ